MVINKELVLSTVALLDSGADSNCIREGLVLSKYFEKTSIVMHAAQVSKLDIQQKLSNVCIIY